MNATKRKFNALIQGMSSRPSSASPGDMHNTLHQESSDSLSAQNLPVIAHSKSDLSRISSLAQSDELKRRRVGGASTISTVNQVGTSRPITTISNIVLKKYPAPKDGKDHHTPRYCPSDREQLISRLSTFQDLTDWTPKPERVGEIEWAKRGWICKGKERVQCTLCHKELVVKLNKKTVDGKEISVLVASQIEEKLVDKYVKMIEESHQEDCLWKRRGCDDSLLRLPLTDAPTALSSIKTRYTELVTSCQFFLPYLFNLRLPSELDLDLVITQLPPDFFHKSSDPNKPALALALLGWQSLTNPKTKRPVPNSASCHTCLRRLGLWMFKSKQIDPDTQAIIEPAPMDHLDLVREHRPFCPWRNSLAQLNSTASTRRQSIREAVPAWQILLTTLKNNAFMQNREKQNGGGMFSRSKSQSAKNEREGPDTPVEVNSKNDCLDSTMPATPTDSLGYGLTDDQDTELDKEENARDKERWARLRKVRTMFGVRDSKKKRNQSRPGTGHSTQHEGKDIENNTHQDKHNHGDIISKPQ